MLVRNFLLTSVLQIIRNVCGGVGHTTSPTTLKLRRSGRLRMIS